MNVLLIYPSYPNTFWGFKHALKFLGKKAGSPPLGLLTVAAMLPASWDKRLVDMQIDKLRDSDLAWADVAMISGMAVQRDSARDVVARCRRAGLRVVAGGPLFTLEHELFSEVDHFVLNEAEVTLPPFLADLAAGAPKPLYVNDSHPPIDRTPVPMWELAKLSRYGWMSVQYSRGCPFQCDFCNVTSLFGHRVRVKSSAQVLAELDALYNQGWRGGVFVVDDNFIGNSHKLKTDLLPALIEWQKGKGLPLQTQVSINLADDKELMHLMVEAGFCMVFIGIETPNPDALAECSKKQNAGRDMVADLKVLQNAGLQVQGGFILGFDSDTPKVFQQQIDFIQNSGIVMAMVGLLQAIPGTRLYERLHREGRIMEQLATGDNVDGTTNVVPVMGAQALREGYRRVMRHIYAPKHYYVRLKILLRRYRKPPINEKLNLKRALALLRASVRLGVVGRERWQYWKLLAWTCWHRRDLLGLAVTLAICGHHFRRAVKGC